MQAREDPPVAGRIEQREREALVAARLLERVVADEADPLEGTPLGALEDRHPSRQLVELTRDVVDLVEVGIEHGLEISTVRPAGQTSQPGVDPARPPRDQDDGDQEHENDDDQDHDEDAEVRLG